MHYKQIFSYRNSRKIKYFMSENLKWKRNEKSRIIYGKPEKLDAKVS